MQTKLGTYLPLVSVRDRIPKPLEPPPTTPPRRSAPFKPSTPPRKVHTSPPAVRTSESPLFRGQDVSLRPSSPPPMSDSDTRGSARCIENNRYTSEGGGYAVETSSDAPPDPDVEMSDADHEPWDETIRLATRVDTNHLP
ncbi:unnamed protein product [Rhizoctonia solani]|uniref:Uncharacterized protein n=1 Tax=Rhizoctonia solani TaxID=456999 RepID=A0A8H2WJD2_9AGAM|nr:unnamed protein product [Rhizoctonia solani]